MENSKFSTVSATDKAWIAAFEEMRNGSSFVWHTVKLGELFNGPRDDFLKNKGIQAIIESDAKVIREFTFRTNDGISVRLTRPSGNQPVAEVFCERGGARDHLGFAAVVATVQRRLGETSLHGIGDILGADLLRHFEARDAALTRLEQIVDRVLQQTESHRMKVENDRAAKEAKLAEAYEQKVSKLEAAIAARNAELDAGTAELEAKKREFDNSAAMHARRKNFQDIKEKFKSFQSQFCVTKGTTEMRWATFAISVALLVSFGIAAGYFLLQVPEKGDVSLLLYLAAKQLAFSALFVSNAYFLVRWTNQWFLQHANEEFRLKRMELDIDRANWFVEMAFEWIERKQGEIPELLVERLTHGLFVYDAAAASVDQADSLAHALLGASRVKVRLTDGAEAEYDRREIERMAKNSRAKSPRKKKDESQ